MNLFNFIKRTLVSRKTADSGQFPLAQVTWNDKTSNINVITPYGLYHNLPINSLVLTFNVLGQEENMAGIGNTPKIRFKNLKEGEVAIGNPLTGSVIKFLENGDIDITTRNNQNINIDGECNITSTGNINIDSPITTITGELRVTGEVTAFYDTITPLTFTDFKNTFNIHTHNENDNAPNPTNPPNQMI